MSSKLDDQLTRQILCGRHVQMQRPGRGVKTAEELQSVRRGPRWRPTAVGKEAATPADREGERRGDGVGVCCSLQDA